MYETYFGLNKAPFAMTPDPNALFLTPAHREALAGLLYVITQRKGFVILVGEAGTGKTTLVRKLLEITPDTGTATSVVLNPTLTPSEFLELLLLNFGIGDLPDSKAQRLVLLEKLLKDSHAAAKPAVLVIDEAHKLNFEVLEEIRLLTNFETSEHKLLQIALVGQPELDSVLSRPELWQLKQRIAVRLTIHPLTAKQVGEYLRHRWIRTCGTQALPFTEEAIPLIAQWSNGIPRLINSICDNALLLAFSSASRLVTAHHILEVVRDLRIRPVSAEVPPARPSPPVSAVPINLRTLERYMAAPQKSFFLGRWSAKAKG